MRRAGLLLHPTSLPSPHGIGDLGPEARRLLSFMAEAGLTVWQTLPLVPVDGSGCPYASPSAFARNTLLLSLDDLARDGWLLAREVPEPFGDPLSVDYVEAIRRRRPLLLRAADRVVAAGTDLQAYANSRPWLSDWALYAALLEEQGPCWTAWPEPLRDRHPRALDEARDRLSDDMAREVALQWLFEEQWGALRTLARKHEIQLWGDIPFFVSGESCDTWAHRDLFRLDRAGRPTVISGVPPDAFSETGQLWGHPLYDEGVQAAQGYRWWIERVAAVLQVVDKARLDHFRGLAAYWEVEAGAEDARGGRWIPGPGAPLLKTLQQRFDGLPLVAEDLGVITPDVEALRDDFELPGMVVLQFAFGNPGDADNPHLPFRHRPRQVVFTGTHDNDTSMSWYRGSDEVTRDHVRRYLSVSGQDIAWDLLRCAWRSVAETAIVPMQDVLRLGPEGRMNLPGVAEGNWRWRMVSEALQPGLAARLREQARLSGRLS